MRLARTTRVVLSLLLMATSVAHAHLVSTGLGPFYDGGLHLALSPEDLLLILAGALLAGLQGKQAGRWVLATLPLAWFLGGLMARYLVPLPVMTGLTVVSFLVLGVLVAINLDLPVWSVSTLVGACGLLHGASNGDALLQTNQGLGTLLGIVSTVFVFTLLVTAAVASLRPTWTRIAARVAGSWVAAVGMLMLGWLYRAGG